MAMSKRRVQKRSPGPEAVKSSDQSFTVSFSSDPLSRAVFDIPHPGSNREGEEFQRMKPYGGPATAAARHDGAFVGGRFPAAPALARLTWAAKETRTDLGEDVTELSTEDFLTRLCR